MVQISKTHKPNFLVSLLALTKASILGSLRNPQVLFFNFLFPFVFITIFGMLGYDSMSFDVAVRPNSVTEGPLYETLKKVDALKFIQDKTDAQISDDLKKGRLAVALTISKQNPTTERPFTAYTMSVEKSAASPSTARSISSILDTVVQSINASIAGNAPKMVTTSETLVEGRKYKQIDFILPGQLAFALVMNALFGIAFTIITFKKELILKRFFATPVKKSAVIASEIISKTLLAILQSVIIISVGHFLFGFTLANGFTTFIEMVALSIVGILVFLSFGLLVPVLAKTEDAVSPVSNLIMMPQLFLSGAFFEIQAFPAFLQPIAKIMPMTFLNEAFKKIAFEGVPFTDVLPLVGGLLVWGILIYIVDVVFFKWE